MPAKVTQDAVQQSAEAAANSTSDTVLSTLLQNPVMFIIGIITIFAFGVIIAIIYVAVLSDEEEEFDKDPLEDIVRPEFKKVVEHQGKKNLSTIRRDLKVQGEIYRDVRFTENDNLTDHMQELAKQDDSNFDASLDLSDPDEETIQELRRTGVYNDEELQAIKEDGLVPHRLMQVRPAGIFGKLVWAITDGLLQRDWNTRYLLIPEHKIVDNPGDNSISIDRNIQLRPFAGVELPLYFESFSVLHAAVTRRLYEASLEDQVNYSEKINFFDSKFSQQVQKLEAEAQAEQQKYNRGVAGDISES